MSSIYHLTSRGPSEITASKLSNVSWSISAVLVILVSSSSLRRRWPCSGQVPCRRQLPITRTHARVMPMRSVGTIGGATVCAKSPHTSTERAILSINGRSCCATGHDEGIDATRDVYPNTERCADTNTCKVARATIVIFTNFLSFASYTQSK